MGFSTKECAARHITLKMLGATITGLRGFEMTPTVDKEFLRVTSGKPIDIMETDEGFTGTLKLLKYEVDKLNDAALLAGYKSILHVPHELVVITIAYKRRQTDVPRTLTVSGVAFTAMPMGMDAGGAYTEVSMPLLAMDWAHS